MYTFGLTMCFLVAVLAPASLGFAKLMDMVIEDDEENIDYGRE